MAAVEPSAFVDTDRLSSFLDIDGPDLQNILDSAAEGVVSLLQRAQVKAKEFEDLRNAKQLMEVNLGEISHDMAVLICRTTCSYEQCQSFEDGGTTPDIYFRNTRSTDHVEFPR